MTQFLEMFTPIEKGNFGLTDEAIYKSIQYGGQFIPVYGGTEEHLPDRYVSEFGKTKYDEPITIFDNDGIVISLDGSSGCMTCVHKHRFALNHHAGFFKVKEKPKQMVIPEYFSLFYEKQFREASISEGSKTLNLKTIESMDFDVPEYDTQKEIMLRIKPVLETRGTLRNLIKKIDSVKECELAIDYHGYQAKEVPITKILDCHRGNSGLTEKEIYHNIFVEGERYEVLSSSTKEDTKLGMIPICYINGEKLIVFEGKEGILVIRNGKAGTTFFLDKGKYTITDHAYILSLKKDCEYQVSLKWFMAQYRQQFLRYTSSADNATWNMTGFFKSTIVDIPTYNEQVELADRYDYLESLSIKTERIEEIINQLFDRQLVN